ncbi:MAG: hypothetical protein H6818_09480 [Phycisphaerales bacterium]|nr:hypothetical protein [Phycisphaerales bacterium]MCB9864116.1 hypothetical protein [Phycisphaerales bacterium]
MLKKHPLQIALASLLLLTFVQAGCSSKSSSDKTSSRKGEVKSIDLANREVVMMFTKKDGTQTPLKGTYTDETVVRINGRVMTIKDIKVGDQVEVVGRKEGSGTNQQLIATEVKVTRIEGDWQETGKDAKPAANVADSNTPETEG